MSQTVAIRTVINLVLSTCLCLEVGKADVNALLYYEELSPTNSRVNRDADDSFSLDLRAFNRY